MAESVKVIDPNSGAGYDYDSLYDWEAAQQADIDTSNTIAVAKCRCTGGTADTTAVTIDGWTTSATDYIKIWTDPAESYRHNGTYQTGNKYRIVSTQTSGNILSNVESYTVTDGIQFYVNATSITNNLTCIDLSAPIFILNSILRGPSSTLNGGYYLHGINTTYQTSGTSFVINSLVYNFVEPTGGGASIGIHQNNTGCSSRLYNCTVINCTSYGIRENQGTVTVKNCYSGGAGSNYVNGTLTTCASSDTTGTAGLQNIAVNTTNFTNITAASEDYHLPVGSALIGVATNLYNDATYPFQTDIDGQDRGGAAAAWDIGADQYNPIALYYRTAATPTALSAASWVLYTAPFTSLGIIQLKAQA